MAQHILVNGHINEVQPKNGTDFTLEELQERVGGIIELVDYTETKYMVVNEEGRLLSLPMNLTATRMLSIERPIPFPIVGDVLVIDKTQMK